ncbi:zinc finger protein 568-like [Penaeus chinensis]|uniref:zinc finger protein 568-like n=1 Tax=Penaeus chinensis TaxID=139456 RepID=UPI001FB7D1F8|nr:zinc finger protein 568-like [Penaeus chinensis]
MEVLARKEGDGELLETLCRLCGTSDCGRMLHLGDTYSMVGASDVIFNLLDSISVILKLQDEDEALMSKHVCLSCFNIAVDVQAFIDSSINFQKTTIRQIFPEHKLVETQDITLIQAPFGSLRKESELVEHHINDDSKVDEPILKSQDLLQNGSFLETSNVLLKSKLEEAPKGSLASDFQKSADCVNADVSQNNVKVTINSSELGVIDQLSKDELPSVQTECMPEVPSISTEFQTDPNVKSDVKFADEGDRVFNCPKEDACDKEHSSLVSQNQSTNSTNSSTNNKSKKAKVAVDRQEKGKESSKKCPVCSKSFPRQSQLKSHLVSHSGTRPFECKICHTKFKYRRNLVEHSSIHNEIPSFICSKCGLTFKQRSNLLKHERIHREKDKHCYHCPHCNNQYTQSSHLRTHIRNVHENNKGHKCDVCDAVVLCQSSLRRHMATVHANSAKFICPHCNRGFNNNQNYQGHLRRHSGERPYSCSTCAKTFTTTKALSRHRLIHQGIKSHKCIHCSKAFYELCDLKKHAKRHLKRVKKSNRSLAASKTGENASNSTTQVVTGMNSLNLMVLTESLLFSEPQPLLETSASRVTEILLPDGKLGTPKEVTAEPLLGSGVIEANPPNLQQSSMELSKISNMLQPGEEVLTPSPLLPATPVLSAENVEAISVLADTAVLQPPETKTVITTPIDPSRVLQPTDIGVEEELPRPENRNVSLEVQEASQCSSSTDGPTMVVLSSVGASSEYLPVAEQETHTGNSDIDGARHQEGERILSHATW